CALPILSYRFSIHIKIDIHISTTTIKITDIAEALPTDARLAKLRIYVADKYVPGEIRNITALTDTIDVINAYTKPATNAGLNKGKTTLRNVRIGPAPKSAEASSIETSI